MPVKLTADLDTAMTFAIYGTVTEFGPVGGPRQLTPTAIKPRFEARAIYELLASAGTKIFPVAPDLELLGQDKVYPSLSSLPRRVDVLILSLPKQHAVRAIEEAAEAGIGAVWFQPATDSEQALALCAAKGIRAIKGCALRHRTVKGLTRFISPCFYMGLKANKLPVG